jgi:protein-tyrosine phosphatase
MFREILSLKKHWGKIMATSYYSTTFDNQLNYVLIPGKDWNQVDDGLYLGNQLTANSRSFLKENKIRYIVNCAYDPMEYNEEISGINYLQLPLKDEPSQRLLPYFKHVVEFIQESLKHGPVLVHCELGISRSPSMIVAYLLATKGMNVQEAFQHLSSFSPSVNPLPSFRKELLEFWKQTLSHNAAEPDPNLNFSYDPKIAFASSPWIDWSVYKNMRGHGKDEGEAIAGFWGRRAAGIMVYAREEENIYFLFFHRSSEVMDPLQWSIPGGAVKSAVIEAPDHILCNALDELREEAGNLPHGSICSEPIVYRSGEFQYHTFFLELNYPKEYFLPKLNWENIEYKWVSADEALQDPEMHKGVKYALLQLRNRVLANQDISDS